MQVLLHKSNKIAVRIFRNIPSLLSRSAASHPPLLTPQHNTYQSFGSNRYPGINVLLRQAMVRMTIVRL